MRVRVGLGVSVSVRVGEAVAVGHAWWVMAWVMAWARVWVRVRVGVRHRAWYRIRWCGPTIHMACDRMLLTIEQIST